MNIYLICQQSQVKYPLPAYEHWANYLRSGIQEAGYTIQEIPEPHWAYGLNRLKPEERQAWKSREWQKTLEHILELEKKGNRPNLILCYLFPEQTEASAISELRKRGYPVVNFFCDNVREYQVLPQEFGLFDLNWVPEKDALAMYQKAKYPYLYRPMPMWVPKEFRTVAQTERPGVSFIGSKDVQRVLLLNDVAPLLPQLEVRGMGWSDNRGGLRKNTDQSLLQKIANQVEYIQQNGITAWTRKIRYRSYYPDPSDALKKCFRPSPDYEQYYQFLREFQVTLGVNRYPSFNFPLEHPDTYSRLRDLEAPMIGACYLTEQAPGISDLFEEGKEILTYSTAEELVEQSKRLLKDSALRKRLRMQGQRKSLEEWSVPASIRALISALGLP
jgi:hypothetical protein